MLVCLLGFSAQAAAKPRDAHQAGDHPKLDRKLNDRAAQGSGATSRVIVTFKPGYGIRASGNGNGQGNGNGSHQVGDASDDVKRVGGKLGKRLDLINGHVVELPNWLLRKLADSPAVESIKWDRPTGGKMNRAAITVGARAVQQTMGYDGAGVGVAIIDSGITPWHDDLTYAGTNPAVKTVNGQRVRAFVDFVNGRTAAYDDFGHGTHVAGIIAGNGYDTRGARAGIAPAANLVSLKVLNDHGGGYISDVIAALDWVVQHKALYNLRVVNLSVGAAVTESYLTDPLTLAAKRAVDAGLVVVTAAGNLGKNSLGHVQYGAITAPGNAPWVLTVGAYSTQGTVTRTDDIMAPYSSRGPTAIDYGAKPDVVAPGTGIVSLSNPASLMYTTKAAYLLPGSIPTASKPYLSLTGTSMAAPMVAGTVALMLEANPGLTPNMVKGIIEYTAQNYGYDALTEGAGFLNTRGAVQLARFFRTAKAGQAYPSQKPWSHTILWGTHKLTHGVIKPAGNAWGLQTVWGAAAEPDGKQIVWGTQCGVDCENIVWGTSVLDAENIVWGTMTDNLENIVWGTTLGCDPADPACENIVWGTMADENIVWGTACGVLDCENIVWGTALGVELENIVWGTTALDVENIVWGTSATVENVVWGTSTDGLWGCSGEDSPLFDDPSAPPAAVDTVPFEALFPPDLAPTPVGVVPDPSLPVAPAVVMPDPSLPVVPAVVMPDPSLPVVPAVVVPNPSPPPATPVVPVTPALLGGL